MRTRIGVFGSRAVFSMSGAVGVAQALAELGLVRELARGEVLKLRVAARQRREQQLGELARLAAVLTAAGLQDRADRAAYRGTRRARCRG